MPSPTPAPVVHPGPWPTATRRKLLMRGLGALGGLAVAGCSGGGPSDSLDASAQTRDELLNLYGYSLAKAAFTAALESWNATPEGARVMVRSSYGASGEQSRKVRSGAPADVVGFSVEPDITRLVDAGLVAPGWKDGPHHGIGFGSVVALVVRAGNPLGITGWDDLLEPGVRVITPNPLSSGSAMWNLLAPYAAASAGGRDHAAGIAYLAELLTGHVHQQPTSASEALEVFRQGGGDVLIGYENEAIAARRRGEGFEHVIPADSFRIDNPVAATTRGPRASLAQAFVEHLATPKAQTAVAKAGYRSVDAAVAQAFAASFPAPSHRLWTIDDLGGWGEVAGTLFGGDGAITRIYREGSR